MILSEYLEPRSISLGVRSSPIARIEVNNHKVICGSSYKSPDEQPNKYETLTQSCFIVGPSTTTLVQHWNNIGLMSLVCWEYVISTKIKMTPSSNLFWTCLVYIHNISRLITMITSPSHNTCMTAFIQYSDEIWSVLHCVTCLVIMWDLRGRPILILLPG